MNRDYLFRYFYRWVSTMKNAHICHDKNIVCFCNDKYHAHIIFYKEFNMMELSIEDKWTEKNVFYLHFEMMDILSTRKNILSFFQFLKDENHHNKVNSSLKLSSLKILICCTSGLTSHYYASLMQQAQQNIIVDAYPIMNVEEVANDYDIILLAPQVAYMYPNLKRKFGKKVMEVEALDFATGNVNHTLESIFV